MSRMTWWFSVYSSFRCASDANDADGMFPCRLFNGLCFFLSHRPKWCPWQFSSAAQPQLLHTFEVFQFHYDSFWVALLPLASLAIDVRLQKDSIWPRRLDVFFLLSFATFEFPLAVSIIKDRCMSSTKNAPGQEREHFNEYSCGNCDCD